MRKLKFVIALVLPLWLCDTVYAGYMCESQTVAPNLTRAVQRVLVETGFNPGPIDGKWGRKTENALKHFQASQNFLPNGMLDQETVDALFGKDAEIVVKMIRMPAIGDSPSGWEQHQQAMEEARQSADIVIIENVEGLSDYEYEEMCERYREVQ